MRYLAVAIIAVAMGACGGRTLDVGESPVAACFVFMSSPTRLVATGDRLALCQESTQAGFTQLYFTGGGISVMADIDEAVAAPGNAYELGDDAAILSDSQGRSCSGILTWKSGEPDWAISVDAACPGPIDVKADWSGHSTSTKS